MTVTRTAAALATVICESATIIASALAEVPRPVALNFSYTPRGVMVTAITSERLADAKPYLDAAFAAHLWGITTGYGPGGWTDQKRLSYQAPDLLIQAATRTPNCLYCNGPVDKPVRGCCSFRCAYLEHDQD